MDAAKDAAKDIKSLSAKELEDEASKLQTSSYRYTIAAVAISTIAARYLPSRVRLVPLALAGPVAAFLDWRQGEEYAAPYRARLDELKAAAKAADGSTANGGAGTAAPLA